MRKSKTFSRLLAAALVLALSLSLAVSAFAVTSEADAEHTPPYQITIKGNSNTDYSVEGRYEAYQIFAGTVDTTTGSGEGDYNQGTNGGENGTGNNPPTANQLADVVWGSGIDSNKIGNLLTALTADNGAAAGYKLTDLVTDTTVIASLAENVIYSDVFASYKSASGDEAKATELAKITLADIFAASLTGALSDKFAVENGQTAPTLAGVITALSDDELPETAAAIAKALSDMMKDDTNNAALSRAFAAIVGAKDNGNYTYLSETKVSSKYADSSDHSKGWTIGSNSTENNNKDLEGGYYLVVDTKGDATGDAKSDYILAVFGNQTIIVKSNVPTVDKDIVVDEDEDSKGGSFETNDEITFKLTGSLPENFDTYVKYKYVFHDTLSTGLTYTGDLVVTIVKKDNTETEVHMIGKKDSDENHTNYTVVTEGTETSGTKCNLEISFADLKELYDGEGNKIELEYGDTIIVEYKAVINEEVDLSALTGETNKVHLEYSNDPTWDGTGDPTTSTTTEETVYVYDFGVDIFKFDGSKVKENDDENEPEDHPLAGAGFALKNEDGKYAVLHKATDGKYYLVAWVSESDLTTYLANDGEALKWSDKLKNSTPATEGDSADAVEVKIGDFVVPESGDYYVAMMTPDNGKLNVVGLEADVTYTFEEVVTPKGYDTIDDFTVEFTAEYYTEEDADEDHLEGMLKSLTYSFNGGEAVTIVENGEYAKDNEGEALASSLVASLEVPNYPAGYLPGTGGIGTRLFYIGGALLLITALACLVLLNTNKKQVA